MLRRTLFSFSASSRRWAGKTSRHASASAHFPQVAFVDPASLRTSAYGAKEAKVFQLDENVDALPVGHQGAVYERNYSFKKIAHKLGRWAEAVRLTDPMPTVLTVIPALWGAGVAMTRLLVWEGADPLVLCAPVLPVHLMAFFFAGVFLLRGALVLGAASFQKMAAVVPPALRPGLMSLPAAEHGGLLGTHVLLSVVILFNLAPVAAQCACASLPLILAASAVRARGGPQSTRQAIWLTSLASAVGVPVGYAAVAGRLDVAVVLPLYVAATLWASLHHTLHELVLQREDEQQQQQTKPTSGEHDPLAVAPSSTVSSSSSTSAVEKAVGGLKAGPLGSSLTNRRSSNKLHSFKTRNDPSAAQSDSVARILPSLMGDTKFYWNVLLAPMTIALVAVGVFSSQTLFYYIGLLLSMMYLQGIIDHVNIYDTWSCRMNYKRNARFGLLMLFFVCCSNGFWGLATEHDPRADKDTANTSSALHQLLRLHIASNQRKYDASDFTWADRFARPVWVQSRILDLQHKEAVAAGSASPDGTRGDGQHNLASIPAWMRREYFGQNVASALRCTRLFDESRIQSWEAAWYRGLDHYNVFTSIVL